MFKSDYAKYTNLTHPCVTTSICLLHKERKGLHKAEEFLDGLAEILFLEVVEPLEEYLSLILRCRYVVYVVPIVNL